MDEERDVEQTSEEEVEAHRMFESPEEPDGSARSEDDDDEVEAHRMRMPEEPGKRF